MAKTIDKIKEIADQYRTIYEKDGYKAVLKNETGATCYVVSSTDMTRLKGEMYAVYFYFRGRCISNTLYNTGCATVTEGTYREAKHEFLPYVKIAVAEHREERKRLIRLQRQFPVAVSYKFKNLTITAIDTYRSDIERLVYVYVNGMGLEGQFKIPMAHQLTREEVLAYAHTRKKSMYQPDMRRLLKKCRNTKDIELDMDFVPYHFYLGHAIIVNGVQGVVLNFRGWSTEYMLFEMRNGQDVNLGVYDYQNIKFLGAYVPDISILINKMKWL